MWAGSHLEFVGCLARGAELQTRVERVVALTNSHGVGFADFYTALSEKVTSKTKYAGSVLGSDRTFCVVPKDSTHSDSPTGTKRNAPSASDSTRSKRRKSKSGLEDEMEHGEQVQEFADDTSKSKGHWVKCVNDDAADELKAHTSMFSPQRNANYHSMLPRARDQIVDWVDTTWYESSVNDARRQHEEQAGAGAEEMEEKTTETTAPNHLGI